jgi:hypothetical protein
MTDSRLPVTNDIRKAFYQAVIELNNWSPPAMEPTVPYGQAHFSISRFCAFVEQYAPEEMPEELVGMVLNLPKHDPNNPVLRNRTFQAGARYVIAVIEQRSRASRSEPEMTGRTRND